jgi:hypothetical protein
VAASVRFLDRPSGPEPPPFTSSDGVQDFVHVHPSHRPRPVHGPEDRPFTKDQELHRLGIAAVIVIGPPGLSPATPDDAGNDVRCPNSRMVRQSVPGIKRPSGAVHPGTAC